MIKLRSLPNANAKARRNRMLYLLSSSAQCSSPVGEKVRYHQRSWHLVLHVAHSMAPKVIRSRAWSCGQRCVLGLHSLIGLQITNVQQKIGRDKRRSLQLSSVMKRYPIKGWNRREIRLIFGRRVMYALSQLSPIAMHLQDLQSMSSWSCSVISSASSILKTEWKESWIKFKPALDPFPEASNVY